MSNALQTFQDILTRKGLIPSEIITDGRLHRCPTQAKPHKQNGAYIAHLDTPATLWWCNWENGQQELKGFHDIIEQQTLRCKGEDVGITVTLGIVSGEVSEQIDHLIVKADELLYIGKNSSKNCVVTQENRARYE